MKPHPYKRYLSRSLWNQASTSYNSIDQLLLSIMCKQPHWWQFRAVCLKTFSRFARAHLQHAESCRLEEAGRVWVGWSWPRCGMALPGVWEPGAATSWCSSRAFRSGLWCLCMPPLCSMMCRHAQRWLLCLFLCHILLLFRQTLCFLRSMNSKINLQ